MTPLVLVGESFYTITLGNIVSAAGTIISILIAVWRLSDQRKKESQEQLREQIEMHTENRIRLDALLKFQSDQNEINRKRDHQINELKNQTAMLAEITKGFDRRLHMLENGH